MASVSFADVVHQSISFDESDPAGSLVLELIDTEWMQRLRDISQTANTRLVFMFSEHSRFGHSLGVAYLALTLINKLSQYFPEEIAPWRLAVTAAAILHDVGHIAPGSHTAYRTWFPGQADAHERLVERVLREDPEITGILSRAGKDLPDMVAAIISHDPVVPPWTWELLSGGGWNADRGNWCVIDSILAGVSYGTYNIPALTESIVLTEDRHLALRENRLDAMMHFAVSRHAMYRQVYQHRVLLAADTLNRAVVQRARDLEGHPGFADDAMREVLAASSIRDLSLETLFLMRESWWRYHLFRWCGDSDRILSDLSKRLVFRRLFKTVRVQGRDDPEKLRRRSAELLEEAGFDSKYYLHEVRTFDMNEGDLQNSMQVMMDSGATLNLVDADPLFESLVHESRSSQKLWLAMPEEIKQQLGRAR